jgi:subtilisin
MDGEAAERIAAELHHHVMLEPRVAHGHPRPEPLELHAATSPPGSADRTEAAARATPGGSYRVAVRDERAGGPVAGATVGLLFDPAGSPPAQGVTDASGNLELAVPPGATPASLVVAPATNFWGVWTNAPSSPATASCPPLEAADGGLGWWHQSLGILEQDLDRGAGVTIGVLDTGLSAHPALAHVEDIGAFAGGTTHPDARGDVSYHGTYTCGVLGARPADGMDYVGVAPGARIVSARIYDANMGCDQGDIALGVHALTVQHRADLINLSLSADERSEILYDAILHALDRGTLCIASAGNASVVRGRVSRAVTWPAAFPEVVAVAAAGRNGAAPDISPSAHRRPDAPEQWGEDGFFLGNMSCFGETLDCIAPGVGIISASPPHRDDPCPWVAMDGTSASSPAATGVVAILLAEDANFRSMPRDRSRAARARAVLRSSCVSLGLAERFQGAGMPRLG